MPEFQVNRFRVTFLGARGTVGSNIGWIQLLQSSTPRGYIYFYNIPDDQALPPDSLGGDDSYVIMHERTKYLDAFLTVLKGPKPLVISFYSVNGFAALTSPETDTVSFAGEQSSDAQVFVVGEQSPDTQGLQILQDLMAKKEK